MPGDAQELVLKITGDSASGQKAVAEIQKQFQSLVKDLGGASGSAVNFGDKLKGALEGPQAAASGLMEKVIGLATAFGPMGAVSAQAAVGVVALAGAMFGLAEHAASVGANLNDMAETVDMSVPELSKLSNAAAVAGTDVKGMTDLVFKMQVQMRNSPEEFDKALKSLSISAKDFEAADWNGKLHMVAEAAKGMGDASERNGALVQLMGKQVRDQIPTLLKLGEAEQLAAGADIWTDQDAAAAEHFEMQLNAIKLQMSSLAMAIGRDLIPVFSSAITLFQDSLPAIEAVAKALFPIIEGLQKIPEAARYVSAGWSLMTGNLSRDLPMTTKQVDGLTAAFQKQAAPILDVSQSTFALGKAWTQETEENNKAASALKKLNDELNKQLEIERLVEYQTVGVGAAEKGLTEALALREEVTKRLNAAMAAQYERLEQIIPATKEWWTLLGPANGEIQVLASHGLPAATGAIADLGSGVEHLGDQLHTATDGWSRFGEGLANVVADIPNVLMHAFTGGGGLTGAFEGMGAQIGGVFGQSITDGLKKKLGSAAGQAAGEAGGGVMGGLLGAFGGAGGLAASIAGGVATMGISVGVQALIHFASKIGKPSKDELAARDTFAKQGFDNVDDFIAGVSARGAKLGMNGEELRQSIQKVLDATHISASAEKSAIEELNAKLADAETKANGVADAIAAANAKPDFDGLTQKAAGFGIALDALGPKFQQANITKTATEYMATFDALKAAGADVGGVLLGMSDEFSKLVQDSIRFGTELPANMKPLIQNLIDARKLTDANGAAIDDITSIHFEGTPIDTSMGTFQDSIEKASGLLTGPGGVTDAIGAVSKAMAEQLGPIPAPWANWGLPNVPNMPDWGGDQAAGGLYHLTRPTLFLAGGPGGEDAHFSGLGKRLGKGAGGGVTVNVAGSVIRESELLDMVSRRIGDTYMQNGGFI